MSEEEIEKTARATLESVGLEHTFDNMPSELSGGMIKRAGFARAVVTNPDIVLYDEPTTGLDPIVTHLLTDTIKRLARAAQRYRRRDFARPAEHLHDGGLYRHALRGGHYRVRHR